MDVKPGEQLRLPLENKGNVSASASISKRLVGGEQLMERVLERENLIAALKRVEGNQGGALF